MSIRARPLAWLREPAHAQDGWHSRVEGHHAGTVIRVELWCEDAAQAYIAMAAVVDEMHRIDRRMSPHKPDSELSRINRDAAAQPVRISAEMFALLARAQHFSALGRCLRYHLRQRRAAV